MKGGKWLAGLLVLTLTGALAWNCLTSQPLTVDSYTMTSAKLPESTRIRAVLLSDLHNQEFGENNAELIDTVRDLEPDLILMAGDMFTKGDSDTDTVLSLCRELKQIAPVYFGLGNHEGTLIYNTGLRVDALLEEAGIPVLANRSETLWVADVPVAIGGICCTVDTYEEYAKEFVEEFEREDAFRILIAHVPALFYEKLASADIDLSVSGHYHGGIVQIPGLGGLYSMEGGLFPRYCGGLYRLEKGHLLVSQGLGEHGPVPRINNPPRVLVLDILAEAAE